MLSAILRFWVPLLLVWLFALRRGGAPERLAGTMLVTAACLTVAVYRAPTIRFASVESSVLLVDTLLLIGLGVLAVRANRQWPMALAALQLVTIIGHLGKALDPNLMRLGYALMIQGPAYPGLLVLAIGVGRHQARLRRYGADTSWRA